jgi:hypothetical protein
MTPDELVYSCNNSSGHKKTVRTTHHVGKTLKRFVGCDVAVPACPSRGAPFLVDDPTNMLQQAEQLWLLDENIIWFLEHHTTRLVSVCGLLS